MSQTSADPRAAEQERFVAAAAPLGQEKKSPVGPVSARKLGYDTQRIDALRTSVTESFCGPASWSTS